jgi:Ca2+-binding RTX toxin-like protein
VSSTALDPIAYDGVNQTEAADHTLLVTDLNQLDAVLADTLPDPVSGQLVSGGLAAATGADCGYIHTLSVGGTVYTYDPTNTAHPISGAADGTYSFDAGVLTVTLAHGHLEVDLLTGDYTFTATPDHDTAFSDTVNYSITDLDGDTVNGSITFASQGTGSDGTSTPGITVTGNHCDNTLTGTAGDDVITGGGGNDHLTGGLGSDVFAWHLADRGSSCAPARDTITDFDIAPASSGGDVLDLRDLLLGESATAASLDHFLDFTVDAGGNTTIHVDSNGASGVNATCGQDQVIVLAGTNLGALGGNDTAIIQTLLDQGKLLVDQNGGGGGC